MIRHIMLLICTSIAGLFLVCADKVTYVSIERPTVRYSNPKYFVYVKLTSRRQSRNNPMYYLDIECEILFQMDNQVKGDFYFYYESLVHQYKPSLIEMHVRACDFVNKEPFIGAAVKRALKKPCPYPPGIYKMENITFATASIPKGLFTKGRIYLNMTYVPNKELILSGHIDMEIRQFNVKNGTKTSKS